MRDCKHVVANTDADFERILLEHAVEVTFQNNAEEEAYESLDSSLIESIRGVLNDLYGQEKDGVLYHQNEDWWPTRTRFLELDSTALTWDLVERLQALLKGPVVDWRINIHAYAPLDAGVEAGAVNVYRDWLLLDKHAYAHLQGDVS